MKPIFNLEYVDNFVPTKKINNEYIGLVVKHWFDSTISSDKNKVYKVVFPKGCSKQLMLHQSGELSGLKTTSIVSENGKIQATAGLEEVIERNEYKLLNFALFGLVEQYLSHQSFITQKLYEIKQMEIKARFERISYVLTSTYEILPELLLDKSLSAPYLNQIVDSNSNCFEMYVFFKEAFINRCNGVAEQLRDSHNNYQNTYNNRLSKLQELLNDNVFAALERFAYGKLCEIFLSNNFTTSYLTSIQKQLHSMMEELINILESVTPWESNFRNGWQNQIDNEQVTKLERERLQSDLDMYVTQYDKIIESLKSKLMLKIEGVETIAKYSQVNDIQLFIKGGELYIGQ